MQKRGKLKSKKGSVLLLAAILIFAVLSVVVSLTYITVMEQKISSKTKSSVGAFFNAESGVEWALNKITSSSGNISSVFGTSNPGNGIDCPDFGNGSPCKVYLLDSKGEIITTDQHITNVKAIRSVGIQGNETIRAIEAAVAQGEVGTYQMTCAATGSNNGICCRVNTSTGHADCKRSGVTWSAWEDMSWW